MNLNKHNGDVFTVPWFACIGSSENASVTTTFNDTITLSENTTTWVREYSLFSYNPVHDLSFYPSLSIHLLM